MRRGVWLLLGILALATTGCSDIPLGGDPYDDPSIVAARATAADAPTLGSVAVAPVGSLSLATDEATKRWQLSESEVFGAKGVRAAVVRAFAGTGAFSGVREAGDDALAEAWQRRDDLVVSVSLENVSTTFEGHNGWWIPNMANWFLWIAPAWWVATSEYSLSLEGVVTVKSAESGRDLFEPLRIPVKAKGTFDEFDRGWPWFGIGVFYCTLDADNWRTIAVRLFPAARTELAVRAARGVELALRQNAQADSVRAARAKTLFLGVGLTRYEDTTALAPVAYAADDVRALSSALVQAGMAEQRAVALIDAEATSAAFRAKVAEHLGRARDGDSTVVYFAGYGTRNSNGAPVLLFHDARLGGTDGQISVEELARLLEGVKGSKLLILDTGFAGRGRSVPGGAPGSADDLAPLEKVGHLVTIAAGGQKDAALAPEYMGSGLLTYQLVQLVKVRRGAPLSANEILDFARPRVIAEAGFCGDREEPRALGLERAFVLDLGARTGDHASSR